MSGSTLVFELVLTLGLAVVLEMVMDRLWEML